jgi:hypothetical protein
MGGVDDPRGDARICSPALAAGDLLTAPGVIGVIPMFRQLTNSHVLTDDRVNKPYP